MRQAYLREWNDLQSATTLAMGDKAAIADIQAYGDPLHEVQQTAERDGKSRRISAAAARLKVRRALSIAGANRT